MTLRCECGGAVTVQRGSAPDPEADSFWEEYECVECGREGRYVHYIAPNRSDNLSGCLTTADGGGRFA